MCCGLNIYEGENRDDESKQKDPFRMQDVDDDADE